MNLFPKITRPNRDALHCVTLIEIFSNYIEHKTVSRLLSNDIRDHLPVFILYDRNTRLIIWTGEKNRRVRTEESNAF